MTVKDKRTGQQLCSTPYGIRGLAHPNVKPRDASYNAVVLNALRHQRFGTPLSTNKVVALAGAQRLTASEVWHGRTKILEATALRCSTPYGIRGLAPPW